MKRALITVATLGILASAGWVVEANAQANMDPNVYPGHMGERYGARGPARSALVPRVRATAGAYPHHSTPWGAARNIWFLLCAL